MSLPSLPLQCPSLHRRCRALGMDLEKPAILLVGGGEGMGPVEKTVDGVAKVSSCCATHLAVVQLVWLLGEGWRL